MAPVAEGTQQPRDQDEKQSNDVLFEEILERCCGTGRWQAMLVAYMSIMWLIFPAFSMSMMYIGATPEFKCSDGFGVNATFASLPADTPKCHPSGENSSSCTRWAYDDSMYESTAVTEWNLVCERKPMLSVLQSVLMLGGIPGSLVGGQLSDRFGRRTVFLPMMLLVTACSFSAALVRDYISFVVVRCLTGFAMAGMIASQYVLVTELSGLKHRAALTTVTYLPFAFGIMLVAAASYGIRTRWLLQMAFAVPCLLLLPNICVMPESPRWLVVEGRFDEAREVLRRAARWNRRQMPPDDEVMELMAEAHRGILAREAALKGAAHRSALQLAVDLVRTPRMRLQTVICMFISFSETVSYFGVSFNLTQLTKSPHLAGVLSGAMEVPTYFIFPLLNRFGRRRCISTFLFTTAVALFLFFIKKDDTFWMVLGLVAKLSASTTVCTQDAYFSELMPTQQRGLALALTQTASRFGGSVAPFIVDLMSDLHKLAPSAVFGTVVLLACISAQLLPETAGRPLPETVADVEAAGRRNRSNARGAPSDKSNAVEMVAAS